MPEATLVEERPTAEGPMIDNPDALLKQREEVKRMIYSKGVSEREGGKLPFTNDELLKAWDQQVEDAAAERAKNKEKEGEKIPDKVLRNLKEEEWEELGWPEAKRKEVKAKLADVVGLKEPFLTHALECIVASGKTPDEALASITQEGFDSILGRMPTQDFRGNQISDDDKQLATKAIFLEEIFGDLKNKQRYIKRFILYDEFDTRALPFLEERGGLGAEGYGHSLKEEFNGKLPDNLFDVAWNIGYEKKERYGIDGKMPVLQMAVHKDKATGKVEGRYIVNQSNFMQWMRQHIWQWYDDWDTDAVTDYFQSIKIDKGSFYSINLASLLFNKQLYFTDETGEYWGDLWQQTLLEPWMMYFMRSYYLEYEKAMNSEEKLSETFNNSYFLSKFTRKLGALAPSMVNIIATLPIDFEGKQNSDTKLGEAAQTMFLIYYNMCDPNQLKNLLGEDSDFFKQKFWVDAINDVAKADLGGNGMPKISQYLGDKMDVFIDAFKKDGKVTETVADWDKFISFLNYFPVPVPSSTWVQIIDQGIKNLVKDKFISKSGNLESKHVDDDEKIAGGKFFDNEKFSLNYAWLIAHSWKFISGAAAKNNFPGVSGHNAETKWQHTREYREKYIGYGGGGNPFTVKMFKQLSLPLFEGITLENAYEPFTVDGKQKSREMVPMEIMIKMREMSRDYDRDRKKLQNQIDEAVEKGDKEAEKQWVEKLDLLEDEEKNAYKMLASKLVFKGDAMRNYAQNIIGRSKALFEQLMGGKEIDFEKFTKYDSLVRGVSFDRAAWQKELQGGLITPLRYLFEANGATQLNMLVRAPDDKGKWHTMYLAEAMVGHEVLDIPHFRKRVSDVTDEEWDVMKRLGYRKRGKYIIRPDGKHDINFDRVQADRRTVWKQWMLMKIGADLWQHISRHSTDPAYGMSHFMNILDAVEKLPGELSGDEFNMKGARITESFFSEEQILWLKRLSGTTTTSLFNREFWGSLVQGDKRKKESLVGESFSLLMKYIFQGYK